MLGDDVCLSSPANQNAAILNQLDGAGDLHQLARRLLSANGWSVVYFKGSPLATKDVYRASTLHTYVRSNRVDPHA
jgi:hypothetical protein